MEQTTTGLEDDEILQFFKDIKSHGKRHKLMSQNNQEMSIKLDFNGRKFFIKSVRSPNEDDHVNNFKITVPHDGQLEKNLEGKFFNFTLQNGNSHSIKHYSTTYLFYANGMAKPYFSKEKNGILDTLSFDINNFSINVMRILKQPQNLFINDKLKTDLTANPEALKTAIEISAMILTTERARDEYSLLISYIEFYKLKHTKDQPAMLLSMFSPNDDGGEDPTLRFPKVKGGANLIRETQPTYMLDKFKDMLHYSPYYEKLQQLPKYMREVLKNVFYEEKLERIRAISEDREIIQRAKFKHLVDRTNRFFTKKKQKIMKKWKSLNQYRDPLSEPEPDQE